MAIPKKLQSYLSKAKIDFEPVAHKTVYTTFDLAATLKEKLDKIAKTLLVKTDKKYVLVVLPGTYRLNMAKLKKILKAKKAMIADEKMIVKYLKGKPGALHPFAKMHKIELVVDDALSKAGKILVRAGSYTDSLRLKVKDLHKLEQAIVGKIGKKG